MAEKVLNIFGEEMDACCFDPLTGWKRDGYCNTDDFDHGSCLLYTSPSPRDMRRSRMPSSA